MNPIETIIARFGGVRPMADKIGVAPMTVQNWKRAGRLPIDRVPAVEAGARDHEITVTSEEIAAAVMRPRTREKPVAA